MPTQVEEAQAREFLQRAEIRTMRKDLSQLRESDSLRERNKIATIKTLDEQLAEKQKLDLSALASLAPNKEIIKRNEVLQKNENKEIVAEKSLKSYANEEERQQIFLLESQRLDFEKQIDFIEKQKEPSIKLQKNELALRSRDLQAGLNKILGQEKNLDAEQKLIIAKSQSTNIASERKSLEGRRWDLDKQIQEIEKTRWTIEKQLQDGENQKKLLDKASEKNTADKNDLQNKILGVDKSLREIYSIVMARQEASINSSTLSKSTDYSINPKAPISTDEERKQFLRDVELLSERGGQPQIQTKRNIINPPAQPISQPSVRQILPVPRKKI